jgi:anti-sigma B factor antagonist
MRSDLSIEVAQVDGSVVVAVDGEVDVATASSLLGTLQEIRAGSNVVVDMRNVGFIDSSGLRVLAGQSVRLLGTGGTLRISNASNASRRILGIASLQHLLFDPPPRMAC